MYTSARYATALNVKKLMPTGVSRLNARTLSGTYAPSSVLKYLKNSSGASAAAAASASAGLRPRRRCSHRPPR